MKYYASDIVKKARIAADLVNSDFVTWYEEVSLLNDVYENLYQHLIELNDPSFVKIIDTTSKDIILPKDFHQLRAVTLIRNGFSTPILRRSFSESYNSMSYEIIGDHLHINTPFVQSTPGGNYHIEYYIRPNTLLFPNADKNITNETSSEIFNSEVLAANRNYIIGDNSIYYQGNYIETYVGNDLKIKVAYLNKDWGVCITDDYPDDDDYYPYRKIFFNKSYLEYDKLEPKRDFEMGTVPVTFPVIFDDNTLGAYNYKWSEEDEELKFNTYYNVNSIFPTNDDFSKDIKLSDQELPLPDYYDPDEWFGKEYRPTKNFIIFAKTDLSDVWSVDENGYVYHFDEQIKVNNIPVIITQAIYKEGILYGKSNNNFITFNPDNTVNVDPIRDLKGIDELNENTGYGLITANDDAEDEVMLKSWVEDTLLDYPNSFFFQTIVYALAVQYKVKQNADPSGLQALYEGYFDNFIKSLPQDVYQPSRITNMYSF